MSKIVVITSGKGGVGKTTTSANIATGIAMLGHKTIAIDFDVGLRNLDLVMGCERRVVYDIINVIKGEAKLQQAIIRDKRIENLYMLPASQTRDKDALDPEGVGRVLETLKDMGFEYIICDSPAGIERGAQMAMYFADEAIVVTNPEVSSVRDSDRVLGLLNAKTSRAEAGGEPIKTHLLLTRYSPQEVRARRDALRRRRARAPRHSVPRRHPRVEGGHSGVEQGLAGDPRRADRRLCRRTSTSFIVSSGRSGRTASSRSKSAAFSSASSDSEPTNREGEHMGFLDYFKRTTKSAAIAKDRLSIIVARERGTSRNAPDYLPQLQQELLQVIAKYELIDLDQVSVNVDRNGGCEVLELNIVLGENAKPKSDVSKLSVTPAASS